MATHSRQLSGTTEHPIIASTAIEEAMAKLDDATEGTPAETIQKNIIVDQREGPYFSIQAAIDDAEPNTNIKIMAGHYKERLRVTKPNLKIEGKDYPPEVYILGYKGPAILIELAKNECCTIQNIKFVHKGGAEKKNAYQSNVLGLDLEKIQDLGACSTGLDSFHTNYEKIEFNKFSDSMIFVKSGGLVLRNC
jgi:hypothetical protein